MCAVLNPVYSLLLMITEGVPMAPVENPVYFIISVDVSCTCLSKLFYRLGSEMGVGNLTLYLF